MTSLVTADLHLSNNAKDDYRHEFMRKQLPMLVKKIQPKRLIILGDVTDQKDCHNAELVNAIVEYFTQLAGLCPLIIMRGNHDCLNPTIPFFQFLQHIPNITWITHPKGITLPGLGVCCFLPHTRNHVKDWKGISFAPYQRDPDCGFIFAHNTFEGADAGHGSPLGGIPTNVFPKKATVISGDIHVPQRLDQITYVGAPYTVTFGDSYEPRMLQIWINKTHGPQLQNINCSGPKKITLDIKESEFSTKGINHGDMVKARVHLRADEYAKWPEIQTQVRAAIEKQGAIAHIIQPVKVHKAIKLARKQSGSSLTDIELMQNYGKRRGVADETVRTGLWLMGKV